MDLASQWKFEIECSPLTADNPERSPTVLYECKTRPVACVLNPSH